MKTDSDLQHDVLEELDWEPSIDAAAIGVAVQDGMVTLSGQVPSFAEKWNAEVAARHVAGVRAVANELSVQLAGKSARTDADIARAALSALEWDVWVPHERITVTVSNGWVKLDGTVDAHYQRRAAERAVRSLMGVQGVTNLIRLTPSAQPTAVKAKITSAFQRSAMLEAGQIQVTTDHGRVVLRGSVHTWAERAAAERAAWAAPGVAEVENQINVQPAIVAKEILATYLRTNGVPFTLTHHRPAYTAQEVAASEHLPGHEVAKVVIAIADNTQVMLVLPADHRADLAKVRAALGARDVWLAEERDFTRCFPDCEVGAMPPFGNLYGLPVYVDEGLAAKPTLVFQAGTHTDTIRIAYADFARLVKPMVLDIARSPRIAAGHF